MPDRAADIAAAVPAEMREGATAPTVVAMEPATPPIFPNRTAPTGPAIAIPRVAPAMAPAYPPAAERARSNAESITVAVATFVNPSSL